uniref:Olfactory receptor n=1 Tax=Sus scrofa TaxID=9823 RepID=A0A4X1VHB5_PIG
MEDRNHSSVTEFILAGLTEQPELQLPLFLLFLGIYMVTVVGNLGMITLIGLSSHLHTPMYYFLSNLSFIDLCHSTVITPKMLLNFVTEKNIISYTECMAQLYFFIVFIIAEGYMLAAMAYDRYVAICNPLLYNVTMSYQRCFQLTVGVYILAITGSTVHTGFMLRLLFCKANVVNHYFCDLFPLLELSCSSIYINQLLVILLSGRSKAFSTCSSHISAFAVFSGSAAFMYLQPSSVSSMDQGKVSSVFYTCIVPMLNPLIYSLRNRDVKFEQKKHHVEISVIWFPDICYILVLLLLENH